MATFLVLYLVYNFMGGIGIEPKVNPQWSHTKWKIDAWDYSMGYLGVKKGGDDEGPVWSLISKKTLYYRFMHPSYTIHYDIASIPLKTFLLYPCPTIIYFFQYVRKPW